MTAAHLLARLAQRPKVPVVWTGADFALVQENYYRVLAEFDRALLLDACTLVHNAIDEQSSLDLIEMRKQADAIMEAENALRTIVTELRSNP